MAILRGSAPSADGCAGAGAGAASEKAVRVSPALIRTRAQHGICLAVKSLSASSSWRGTAWRSMRRRRVVP
eukprot:4701245-Prymnesium_polylepis.2